MSKAKIHYYDIGDYLSREEKLKIIADFGSAANVPWVELQPNEHGDWISQRNEGFDQFIPIEPEKKYNSNSESFFLAQSLGTATNRDTWVYNFSKSILETNIWVTVEHYNDELDKVLRGEIGEPMTDSVKGNWTRDWVNNFKRRKRFVIEKEEFRKCLYRPFTKVNCYFADDLNQERYQLPKMFPQKDLSNLIISITGLGVNKDFSAIISNNIVDLQLQANGQVFSLHYFEERPKSNLGLFDEETEGDYIKRDGVSDYILEKARNQYNATNISKEDIFYYVYGFLHSPTYRETFANDLKKMLPRLPLVGDVRDFWAFSNAGRKLADLHLNYESVPAYEGVSLTPSLSTGEGDVWLYRVEKMRFPKKDQKDTILYNSQITISNIPAVAYEYVVNGKSAIEWIMERYAVTTHKESQIKNDPNDWAKEVGNPRYILDLLLSIINVSVQTVEIVKGLPRVEF